MPVPDLKLHRPPAPREALGRFKPGRLGDATGSGRDSAPESRARRPIQSHYVAVRRGAGVKSPFAPVRGADEPVGRVSRLKD